MTELAVAIVGVFGAVIVALIETTRRQNNRDHATNSTKLDRVIEKIDHVDTRVSGHIEWHAHRD